MLESLENYNAIFMGKENYLENSGKQYAHSLKNWTNIYQMEKIQYFQYAKII